MIYSAAGKYSNSNRSLCFVGCNGHWWCCHCEQEEHGLASEYVALEQLSAHHAFECGALSSPPKAGTRVRLPTGALAWPCEHCGQEVRWAMTLGSGETRWEDSEGRFVCPMPASVWHRPDVLKSLDKMLIFTS